ncbi:homeobox-leucine zipper protein roc8 [Phtheirospermum japonicum]|uniref:Homeobox-leucine zipper protein roc8 n=1 Tax=Phtheirospermum japonicum TaxID=374723 RepID=A0A830B8Z4_9LAMI|nr:homeobox-leucine zipper protein roc8 [Phtheirospermum japonicum]
MALSYGGSGSGEEEIYNSQKGKKQYHRHSTQQIQQLEAFYKECPHPDKNQRQQLSRELGLDPKQIKFWFQNKRTQIKAQNEKADNNALRTENEKIHFENLAMQEALKTIICPSCNGSCVGEEEKHSNLVRLRMENVRLKEEHERAINFFANYMGNLALPLPGLEPLTNMPGNHFPAEGMGPTALDLEQMPRYPENPISPHWSNGIMEMDRSSIIETAIGAINELMDLMNMNEPVWARAPADGRYTLHRDSYDKLYPHSSHIKTASARFESSKDSGEVAMTAMHLLEMLFDANKWMEMFPTIVAKAKTIEVLDTGILGGSLHLMYEKVHVLSPLVAPREFFFIRYCRQLNPTTWVMVDVSYDFMKGFQDAAPTRSWKLPSGCMIEDMANGKSTVTWVEHIQVDDKSLTHRLYRDLVRTCQAYGAKRWITTLQRMCERFAFSMGLITTPKHELEGVIASAGGQRNLMKLSHRMVKTFCEALSMSDKLDFPHLSEFENSGVRVSFRKSNEPGQLDGFVVTAATSIWLPLLKENLFEFLKDEKNRAQWDVLSSGNPANAIAHISTGTNPGNCISIIQPFVPKETKMLMLQESSIDSLGALLIYAPMDLSDIISVVNGEETMKIAILPSGYVISGDGRAKKSTGASSSSNTNYNSTGSLLTVALQILVCRGTLTKELNMESVANVHSLISSTIQKIKAALDISD